MLRVETARSVLHPQGLADPHPPVTTNKIIAPTLHRFRSANVRGSSRGSLSQVSRATADFFGYLKLPIGKTEGKPVRSSESGTQIMSQKPNTTPTSGPAESIGAAIGGLIGLAITAGVGWFIFSSVFSAATPEVNSSCTYSGSSHVSSDGSSITGSSAVSCN
jgi:hypothetical protein